MIKEIKYLVFIIIISLFLFFTIRYYFSDNNEKRNYRSLNQINQKLNNYAKKLPILENDTQNIIQYVEQNNTKKKKYKFWKLLEPND
jgi:hypothetical protein|tara:strand:- start:804 stop:1064 length:261 start_codon:yes stop_codon:yes gene_type:complete